MTNGSQMKVESIAECSLWSILQYFWTALSDNWSWKPIFCLFESGRFTQVLLYFLIQLSLCWCFTSQSTNFQSCWDKFLSSIIITADKASCLRTQYSASNVSRTRDPSIPCKHSSNWALRFSIQLSKHVFCVLNRTVSLRGFFWAPTTYVLLEK